MSGDFGGRDSERPWEDPNPLRPGGAPPPPPSRRSGLQRYRMFFLLIAAFVLIAVVKGNFNKVDKLGAREGRFIVFSKVLADKPGKTKPVPGAAVIPAGGGEGRPLLVLIAGRDQTLEGLFDKGFYASLAALGLKAPDVVVLAVDRDSEAHDRHDAKWGTYLLDEALPEALRQTGADPKRVAIGGFDAGGFGALDLARIAPARFCAVGAHSPELWKFGDARPGAFDDAADFAARDLLALAAAGTYPYTGPLRVDVGTDDPLRPEVKAFVDALRAHGRKVDYHELPGKNGINLWRAESGNLLRWYSTALASCKGRG